MQRPLSRLRDTLWPNGRIELVLDLQYVGVDLQPFAISLRADRLVRRIRLTDGFREHVEITIERVVTWQQRSLRWIVGVAEIAHPQAGGVGQIKRVRVEGFKRVRTAAQEL